MRNGEGAEDKLSFPITSPCDPPGDQESEGGDELSHYSSCGAESEFERYCSASSAMGTPSFRSSSSFRESDFGSLKSFKLGSENTNLENFGARKILSGFSNEVNEFYSDESVNRMLNLNRTEGFVVSGVDLTRNLGLDDDWGNDGVDKNGSMRNLEAFWEIGEGKECHRNGTGVDDGDGMENGGGEEVLSNYEQSEGDDSMFGCGSDDEQNIDLYYVKNDRFSGEEIEQRNENQLAMNSSVAFGSYDRDDFVHESGQSTIISMFKDEIQLKTQTGIGFLSSAVANSERQNEVKITPVNFNKSQAGGKLTKIKVNNLPTNPTNLTKLDARAEDVNPVLISNNQVSDITDMDELEGYIGSSSGGNIFEMNKDMRTKEAPVHEELNIRVAESKIKHQVASTSEVMNIHHDILLNDLDLEKIDVESNQLSESVVNYHHTVGVRDKEDNEVKSFKDNSFVAKNNDVFSLDQIDDHIVPIKARDFDLNNNFYDEIVNDMEDILLDTGESHGSRLTHGTRMYQPQFSHQSRDGGSTASTSHSDYAYNWIQQPLRVDKIEVVGSRQKEGDVSFSERLVGVKKYTVYKIRVWSGENNWEVERRYRDFSTLYHRLKKLFSDHERTLPSPWSFVDRESIKLFGNSSPDVIANRSVLIQECLQSIIHPKYSSNSLNALVCFLSPSEGIPDSPISDASAPQSPFSSRGEIMEKSSTLGQKISLVVQIGNSKSTKQMLDSQHYRCAGCHKFFDDGITRVQEFVKSLGWGKPRLCEYSSQLFCSSCHNNDVAILPARVLHYWDFTRYPVSQMAKSYLDSIHDQPMLCVSAVNPFLFSKFPTLKHVANIRNRIRTTLPYVHCPFRGSIYKGLGSRRYLLDSHDFFALRDLIDLSKGVFSALPVMIETVSRKIEEHITEQCLVCYNSGIPCSARQVCNDSLSLIFPFQEGEVKRCKSCDSVFHKNCFNKTATCSCGTHFKHKVAQLSVDEGIHSAGRSLNLEGGMAEPSAGLLASLFSKVMPQRSQI